jgi:Rft protein
LHWCSRQVNGILEAYVHASASSRQLVQINVGLVVFAAAHMALSVLLVRLGDALGEHTATSGHGSMLC